MNIGSRTGPWGSVRIEARALVVFQSKYGWSAFGKGKRQIVAATGRLNRRILRLTEHLAIIPNSSADVDIIRMDEKQGMIYRGIQICEC